MSLVNLVAFAEEGPWCATVLRPPRPGSAAFFFGPGGTHEAGLNPQPLPPDPEAAARLWQAVRLRQCANLLAASEGSAAVADSLRQASDQLYEGWDLPRMPWLIVLRWLGRPPPPPPPWLERVTQAAGQVVIGARMGGDFGLLLHSAASAVILEQLAALRAP